MKILEIETPQSAYRARFMWVNFVAAHCVQVVLFVMRTFRSVWLHGSVNCFEPWNPYCSLHLVVQITYPRKSAVLCETVHHGRIDMPPDWFFVFPSRPGLGVHSYKVVLPFHTTINMRLPSLEEAPIFHWPRTLSLPVKDPATGQIVTLLPSQLRIPCSLRIFVSPA